MMMHMNRIAMALLLILSVMVHAGNESAKKVGCLLFDSVREIVSVPVASPIESHRAVMFPSPSRAFV